MSEIPSFIASFEAEPEISEITFNKPPISSATSHPTGPSFTLRDWEMLKAIELATVKSNSHCTNGWLASKMGLTNGAVSLRIKRLSKMGLIKVVHYNATDTGKNNRRTIEVLMVPPKPWSPE